MALNGKIKVAEGLVYSWVRYSEERVVIRRNGSVTRIVDEDTALRLFSRYL